MLVIIDDSLVPYCGYEHSCNGIGALLLLPFFAPRRNRIAAVEPPQRLVIAGPHETPRHASAFPDKLEQRDAGAHHSCL